MGVQPIKEIYERAFWDALKSSIKAYEPVFVTGRMQFRIHKWLYKLKSEGKIIPMPDGIREAEKKVKSKVGEVIKFTTDHIYAGIVKKELGDRLAVLPLVKFTEYKFRSSVRFQWKRVQSGVIIISSENYTRTPLIRWLESNKGRIDPMISPRGFVRGLRS